MKNTRQKNKRKTTPRIILTNSDGEYHFHPNQIVCIKAISNQVEVHPSPGSIYKDKIVFSKTLAQVEEELPAGFIRTHRTWIVNMEYICFKKSNRGCCFKMANGNEVSVSRRKAKEVIKALNGFKPTIH